MDGLIEGRNIHFVAKAVDGGDSNHYTALVTRVIDKNAGLIDLTMFDNRESSEAFARYWSVPYSEHPSSEGDSWHFIERA